MNTHETMSSITSILILIIIYLFNKNHVMNNLIMIEIIMISVMMLMFNLVKMTNLENYLALYIIIVGIVESMVGLSTLIAMIRTHGNDYLKSMALMKL